MPTPTYIPLATKTLTAATTTVTFSSISQSYRDLILLVSNFNYTGAGTAALLMTVNGDSTSIYNYQYISGAGSLTTALSLTQTNIRPIAPDVLLNTGGQRFMKIDFFDYSQTSKNKPGVYRYGNTQTPHAVAGTFRIGTNTAITSISMTPGADQFSINSVFTLYGIAA